MMFGDKAEIRRNFSTYLEELRNSEKSVAQTRIYIHGEKESESKADRIRTGIPVNEKTLKEMKDISLSLGINIEQY